MLFEDRSTVPSNSKIILFINSAIKYREGKVKRAYASEIESKIEYM